MHNAIALTNTVIESVLKFYFLHVHLVYVNTAIESVLTKESHV